MDKSQDNNYILRNLCEDRREAVFSKYQQHFLSYPDNEELL